MTIALENISVKNYRSLRDASIEFHETRAGQFYILIGVNESGKSNLLKAIGLLSGITDFDYERDCYRASQRNQEEVSVEITVKGFQEGKIQEVLDTLPDDIRKKINANKLRIRLNISKKGKREITYSLEIGSHGDAEFRKYVLLEGEIAEDSDGEGGWLTRELLENYLAEKLKEQLGELVPPMQFWQGSDKYLLSRGVDLDGFKNNLGTNIPLRNVFLLAGIKEDKIVGVIDDAKGNVASREELESLLSNKATEHIETIWPEHKTKITVRIEKDMHCSVTVEDIDTEHSRIYMEQRSDGFKQFVSMLLSISAENSAQKLKETFVLLDEPEVHLHPSSVQYLRRELLKISDNNVVITATHSIFLVDKTKLDRHYIVKKSNGKTTIKKVEEDNPLEEEIIYEALGTSIYEIIEPYIVIFEGALDKKIFDAFTQHIKKITGLSKIKSIGASGVNEVHKYVKFFDQRLVTGIVVVDSDKAGRGQKKSIIQGKSEFKATTFELEDLVGPIKDEFSLEDLISEKILRESLDTIVPHHGDTIDATKAVINEIKRIANQNNRNPDEVIESVKKEVIERAVKDSTELEAGQLEKKYPLLWKLVIGLHEKIAAVQGHAFALAIPESSLEQAKPHL